MHEPISYTNRKGKTYYLHAVVRKSGKTSYVMKTAQNGALPNVPEGYVISEGVNGEVSVGRPAPRVIMELEEALVASKLKELGLKRYRHQVKGAYITIYEPNADVSELRDLFSMFSASRAASIDRYINDRIDTSSVSPVMRFQVVDKATRLFVAERMTYRGDGGWRPLYSRVPLVALLTEYLPHLGKDTFFEL